VIPAAEHGTTLHVYVVGVTAANDDFATVMAPRLLIFIAVIVVLGFLLLLMAFRSLLRPAVDALCARARVLQQQDGGAAALVYIMDVPVGIAQPMVSERVLNRVNLKRALHLQASPAMPLRGVVQDPCRAGSHALPVAGSAW
jgi:MMPL family